MPPGRLGRARRSSPTEVWRQVRKHPDVREALEWMWPVLTPAELLHDLFGSKALLDLAGGRPCSDEQRVELLHRPRSESVDDVVWTHDDVPLLDEARALLGPSRRRQRPRRRRVRTYGHIVVDEAQDLSPMQLRMLSPPLAQRLDDHRRRHRPGHRCVGPRRLGRDPRRTCPTKRPARRERAHRRLPHPRPEHGPGRPGARVAPRPTCTPPRSVRQDGARRAFAPGGRAERPAARPSSQAVRDEIAAVGNGNVAVICPASLVDECSAALTDAGIEHGVAIEHGLDHQVTVVPVGMVKGLELDATVVVEPAGIVDEEAQGLRALYVALTRATKRLTIVHAGRPARRACATDDAARAAAGAAAEPSGVRVSVVTRMRVLAKAPMPTWRPSISTVVVPSGDAAVTVPAWPGQDRRALRGTRAGRA